MSEGPSPASVAALLRVKRNAFIGIVVGMVLAGGMYAIRVFELFGPLYDARASPALFLVLAFVLAVTTGLLVTIVLTVRRAVRVARE